MTLKDIPWWAWAVPAALLIIATARMPIGYYGPLRFAICACAALYAYAAWNENRIGKALAVAFVLLALLFNPVVPVRLSRSTWFYFNVGGAALFAVGMLFAMLKGRR